MNAGTFLTRQECQHNGCLNGTIQGVNEGWVPNEVKFYIFSVYISYGENSSLHLQRFSLILMLLILENIYFDDITFFSMRQQTFLLNY